jgi:galacturan 1,4-alpha-galacturonidase
MRLLLLLLFAFGGIGDTIAEQITVRETGAGKECTVAPLGGKKDDTPGILNAFKECNNGGTVIFPKGNEYWIATRLNPTLNNVKVEWRGQWTVSSNHI